jgi:phage gpG-like protein
MTIQGISTVLRVLDKIADVWNDEKIITESGNVIRDRAKRNVEEKLYRDSTGYLESEIITHVENSRLAEIGTRPNRVVYARIHEFGGVIKPKKAKMLFIPIKRGVKKWSKGMKFGVDYVLAKQVIIPKRPYLRPAADETRSKVVKSVSEMTASKIERIAK